MEEITTTNGTIINHDSNEVYHSKKEYIGSSGLKNIKKSPAHFKADKKEEQTQAMMFGTAYHTLVLEPELFEKEIHVFDENARPEPDKTFGSKANKIWKLEQYSIPNKTVITAVEFSIMQQMYAVLVKHPYAKSLLKKGIKEQSFYTELPTQDSKTIKVKVRPDNYKREKRICIDLKTCVDASADGFQKQAAKMNYHISAALYTAVLEQCLTPGLPWSFMFVAQEKTPPYAFNIFNASPQFLSQGKYEYEMLLLLLEWCRENERYPGYQVFVENKFGILELSLPPYAIKELDFFSHKF
jgi:hypothetical protein